LSGVAVVYEPSKRIDRFIKEPGREQGSLYSWQKRKIADATEWLRINAEYPLIFCLTSPGFTSMANATNILSKFINNVRKRYGLGHYVWVRELTKRGYPHFHFIADWHSVQHWFKKHENGETNIQRLSLYWSSLFGERSTNSIWLGTDGPKRTYYVEDVKQCRYLAKYIGKNIGQELSYLCEAGFTQTTYKKAVRTFCVSPELSQLSAPVEYEQFYNYEFVPRSVYFNPTKDNQWKGGFHTQMFPIPKSRSWGDENFSITDDVLKNYDWRNTGHGDTYVGFLKRPK